MTTEKISRATILKALAFEPLKSGAWEREGEAEEGKCSVCAVGAVLRRKFGYVSAGEARIACQYIYTPNMDHNVKWLLKDGNYLGALSVYFERMLPNDGSRVAKSSHRMKLIRFVLKNFPATIEVPRAE